MPDAIPGRWHPVGFPLISEATRRGRLVWFRIYEPGRRTRMGLFRPKKGGARYEFRQRGGAWLRRLPAGSADAWTAAAAGSQEVPCGTEAPLGAETGAGNNEGAKAQRNQ